MTLLTWDDFLGYRDQVVEEHALVEGPVIRWQELTVRRVVVFLPNNKREELHEDVLSSVSVGEPVQCTTCGKAAISLDGYPAGLRKYGPTPLLTNVYCPHCDGGEDIG